MTVILASRLSIVGSGVLEGLPGVDDQGDNDGWGHDGRGRGRCVRRQVSTRGRGQFSSALHLKGNMSSKI